MLAAILFAFCGLAVAAPQGERIENVPILADTRNGPDGDGNFDFKYETGDGIFHEARGRNDGDGIVRVQGRYSFTSPEGEVVEISYTADERGFLASGDALPTPPPAPPHALAQIRAAEAAFAKQKQPAFAYGLPAIRPSFANRLPAGVSRAAPVARSSERRPG
ncbi:cuticle protein AMP1B [Hyalella azteca]|uniref:Cuticle protein AMP1B n=1 Tax=Hyalella azteca TaxID=294128 RepID=A0A979FRD4_HYAAZ|nr:cuticle protein AMP1B [Hyalella azteca]